MKKYKGRCSCGDIEYCFDGEPINTAFCYCHDCQRSTGSDKWFGLWVATKRFQFTKGRPSIYTRKGDGDNEVHLNFCSNCNTTLCAEITVANFYSVAASTLNDSNVFSPKMAIYTASAPQWAVFPEGVPAFDVLPPGTAK